jgi:hypothetical protein
VILPVLLVLLQLQSQSPNPALAPGMGPREEVFKMVDAYIVSNLQDSLGLTDDQFARLVPLVKRLQTDRRELTLRRQALMREMRAMLQAGTATESRVSDVLKDVKAVDAELPVTLKRDQDAIDASLNPLQQAKYRVLEFNVDQRIRGLMNRWVQSQRQQQGAGREMGSPPPQQP